MANKDLILKYDISTNAKSILTLLCTAQEISSVINRNLGKIGLSQEQLQVLHFLDESNSGILTVNQIKESFLTDSPNISRMLNKLVEKKLAIKNRDSKDQRIVYIKITEQGREMHRQADEIYLKAIPELPEKDAGNLLKILMKL